MRKYFCDRCDKECKEVEIVQVNINGHDQFAYRELCSDCLNVLMLTLNQFLINFFEYGTTK